jgi:hypothetical protein
MPRLKSPLYHSRNNFSPESRSHSPQSFALRSGNLLNSSEFGDSSPEGLCGHGVRVDACDN